jgi:cytochrome c553
MPVSPAHANDSEARSHTPASETIAVAPAVLTALSLQGDIESGRLLYSRCAVCHRDGGQGRADGTFPQLAGQHRSVLIKQLVDIRDGRRSNPIMAPYAEALIDAQEIADVTRFISTLPVPPSDAPREPAAGSGRRLFERDCANCHGIGAEGDAERFVPSLAGQHSEYLLRQVRAIAAARRGNAHPEMTHRLARYSDADLQSVVAYATRPRDTTEHPVE